MKTELLAGLAARLAYVTPSHQFPLGGVMPVARRHQLLEWARRNDAWVIEDDYDSEYRYGINPVPPLHALEESSKVIYLGTISKTLAPTLRIGYLVVPHDLQEVFATAKQLTDRHSPLTEQTASASLIESGAYERHIRRARRLNAERRETLLNVLRLKFSGRIVIEGADAGLHIIVRFRDLPRSLETALIETARRASVDLHSISPLYALGSHQPDQASLVMGYAVSIPAGSRAGCIFWRKPSCRFWLSPRRRGVTRCSAIYFEINWLSLFSGSSFRGLGSKLSSPFRRSRPAGRDSNRTRAGGTLGMSALRPSVPEAARPLPARFGRSTGRISMSALASRR
ncbi:MAG: GntR family transcriptional regulator [Microvirga sp.]|jgi:hypothetical protein|nr:GntR family transcriptional regulator [Microvirga sp.]